MEGIPLHILPDDEARLSVSDESPLSLSVSDAQPVELSVGDVQPIALSAEPIEPVELTVGGSERPYGGAYRVTPSRSNQVLPTIGRYLDRDIVIEAIPGNYGLVEWNGSVLTIS